MPRGLTLLCAAKLHANQLERHLELFEHIDEVERVLVVRHEPIPERLSKVQNCTFRQGSRPGEALRMVQTVRRLIEDTTVDWVIGFNPVPWGTLAFLAAQKKKVPTCLSLIGLDFLQVQKAWGRPFLEAVRRADAVTVTGQQMVDGLLKCGVAAEKLHILPHSVDTARFVPGTADPQYDVVSVGQLIHRKRMDVLIDAIGILAKDGVMLRAAILGRGPLEEELKERARARQVEDQITFLGYRDDVEAVLASARIFCLASEWEGVPFALMEALSSGLVPIVTDVGTISDWVTHNHNGQIVPVGDAARLATTLRELVANEGALMERLRAQVLAERAKLTFESGAAVWRDILGLSAPSGR